MKDSLAAVIVAFQPKPQQLMQLLDALAESVGHVIVCDNGGAAWVAGVRRNVVYVSMGGNVGVGAALNAGFRWAHRHGYAWVVTFDQDSAPQPGCLPRLTHVLRTEGETVAAVAPMIRDARSQRLGPLVGEITAWWRRPKLFLSDGVVAPLDHAITSGMVVRLDAWRQVGPFREDFFIDYIDIEWCVRARARGYRILGVGGAELLHELGERWLFLPGGARVAVHRPERVFYELRNGIWTHRLARDDWRWRLWHWWIGVKKGLFYLLFLPERRARLRAMMAAVRAVRRSAGDWQ